MLVTEAGSWGEYEDGILDELLERKAPVVVVFNKCDLVDKPAPVPRLQELKLTPVLTAASEGRGVLELPPGAARRGAAGLHRQPPRSSATS